MTRLANHKPPYFFICSAGDPDTCTGESPIADSWDEVSLLAIGAGWDVRPKAQYCPGCRF